MPIPPAPQRVRARINSAGSIFTRRVLNLIAGAGVTIAAVDDAATGEIDVTFSASSTETYGVVFNSSGDVALKGDGTIATKRN